MSNATSKNTPRNSDQVSEPSQAFGRLCDIMARLRAADGCPWDAEQTPTSLKPYILEEAYEVLEAIDSGSATKTCEELGDLLLQVVFQAQIFSESGDFNSADVANGICDKLIRRHPHVFADVAIKDQAELHKQWDAIKKQERRQEGAPSSTLASVPKTLPSLMRTQKMTSRASRSGFDWKDVTGPRQKLREEIDELDRAIALGNQEQIHHELGDLLLSVANLARHLNEDAELALLDAGKRFQHRFEQVEKAALTDGYSTLHDLAEKQLMNYWNDAKKLTENSSKLKKP